MGYLDNSSVTIDAILTIAGREALAKGNFNITKFALGDDEVDYRLWNTNHPLGSSYYGIIIENMPILEAIPDDNSALRSKLISLKKGATKIPAISIGASTSFTLKIANSSVTLSPKTDNIVSPEAYTIYTTTKTLININGAKPTVDGIQGNTFVISANLNTVPSGTTKSTTITIVDNMSGATLSASIIVTNA
mgnify:CR=1 FL=1|jgi:hypothetical protein